MFRLARSSSLTRRRLTPVSTAVPKVIVNGRRLLTTAAPKISRRSLAKLPVRTGRPGDGVGGGWYVPGLVGVGAGWFMWNQKEEFRHATDPAKDLNFKELTKLIASDASGSSEIALTEVPEELQQIIAEDDLEPIVIDSTPIADPVEEVETVAIESTEAEVSELTQIIEEEITKAVEEVQAVEEPAVVEVQAEEPVSIEESTEEPVSVEPAAEPVDTVQLDQATEGESSESENTTSSEEKPDIDLAPAPVPEEIQQVECDPHALPEYVPYVIVGGGAASFAAMRSITGGDPGTKVLILTDEEYAPYQRPPLSKEFWAGDTELASESLKFENWGGKVRSVYMDDEWHYAAPGELMHYDCTKVGLACNSKVSHIDTNTNTAMLADGRSVKYGKCLVAIGGKPKRMTELEGLEEVTYYRHLNDFRKLERQCREDFKGKTVAVIGGGFLGSELAVALGGKSKECGFEVQQIIKEKGNLGFLLPDYLSWWTKEKVDKCGVTVTTEAKVTKASKNEAGRISLELSNGETMECDHVVAAVGLEIDRQFADKSGLQWDDKRGGMVVNSELQACKDVWIAGDATSFHDKKLGRRRVEHHDHAIVTGRLAGSNMVNEEEQSSYWHQSMYWCDLGSEVGFEAIGLTCTKTLKTRGVFNKATDADTPRARDVDADGNSSLNTEGAAASKDYGKGVMFYTDANDRVVGVVSWNLFGKMKKARKVISDEIIIKDDSDLDELAKLFFPQKKKAKTPAPPTPITEEPSSAPVAAEPASVPEEAQPVATKVEPIVLPDPVTVPVETVAPEVTAPVPEQVEITPVEAAPEAVAPVEVEKVILEEPAPLEVAPVETAVEPTPGPPAQVEAIPEPAAAEPVVVEQAPVEQAPVETSVESAAPVEQAQPEPVPVQPSPTEQIQAPIETTPAPVESAPQEPVQIQADEPVVAEQTAAPVEKVVEICEAPAAEKVVEIVEAPAAPVEKAEAPVEPTPVATEAPEPIIVSAPVEATPIKITPQEPPIASETVVPAPVEVKPELVEKSVEAVEPAPSKVVVSSEAVAAVSKAVAKVVEEQVKPKLQGKADEQVVAAESSAEVAKVESIPESPKAAPSEPEPAPLITMVPAKVETVPAEQSPKPPTATE